jgi:hypothetical protein
MLVLESSGIMDGTGERTSAGRACPSWRRLGLGAVLALTVTFADGLGPLGAPADAGAQTIDAAAARAPAADVQLSLAGDWQVAPEQGFALRIDATNAGDAPTPLAVEAQLHPALGNVTVTAPGFSCSRQFAASGPRPGTAVSCAAYDPLAPGETATVTVRARASSPGTYPVEAAAIWRDGDAPEASRASAGVRVAAEG